METTHEPRRWRTAWLALAPLALIGATVGSASMGLTGCDAISKLTGKVRAPGVGLNRVDLVDFPSLNQIKDYACNEWIPDPFDNICDSRPSDSNMLFSFDVVFDIENKNDKLPIPLVEVLMGITVYGDEDLGAVCISFCDPDEEDCTATTDAEGACDVESAEEVDNPADLVPNGNGIRGLADAVADGDFDNDEFRVVDAGETIEAHIQFDLDIDTMIDVSETAMVRAYGGGGFTVPYTIDGTVFFDVPELGRYAFGFGPFEGEWAKW